MRALRQNLWNNVFTFNTQNYERWYWSHMEDFSTLLLGETGTGKGSAAAAIGRSGFIPFDPRTRRFAHSFSETFVAINLSQYPETLIESELFGHRKGSFTGAVDNHKGLLESCRPNGTLFLDEIGDVGIPTQIKLLNVLQERTFAPLGGHDTLRFHGRVVAATNHSIDDLRSRGSFREDFYYRLCSDVITLPTLRERVAEAPAELEQLVTPLVARLTGGARPELTATVLAALARDLPPGYAWPGNVRELEQAVRRVLVKGHYNGHLTMQSQGAQARLQQGIDEGRLNAADLVEGYCALLYERYRSYQEVARRTGLDRRTAKKHVLAAALRRL